MSLVKKYLPCAIFVLSIFLGGYLRFYKLDWGQGYYFHPDEYHIVGAVGRLINEGINANPQLFSYGSFTVYLTYITHWLLSSVIKIDNPNVFIIGRFLAALFSTLTLANIFLITKSVFPDKRFYPELTTLTAAFTPGLIQQAHFLTPESFMTFWITLSTYFFIKFFQKHNLKHLIFSALAMGLAGGTKISSFAVLPFFLLTLLVINIKKSGLISSLQKIILYIVTVFTFFFAVFPYSILDYEKFINTTRYESSLSMGFIKVFYTRSFDGTAPFLFQLRKICPYTLGVILCVFSFVGFFLTIIRILKKDRTRGQNYIILCGVFLSYFVFNALLFTKWTRFVHPTIPFLIIFSFIGVYEISQYIKNSKAKKNIAGFLATALVIPTATWGMMFFSIYNKNDIRITATDWMNKNITKNKTILTETGNTLEVPLMGNYDKNPFDFYNVDRDPTLYNKLITDISKSDYFIIQSRRIYLNHNDKSQFPIVYNFYNTLFSGDLGFEEISEFNSYPNLKIGSLKLEIPDENAEETWTVFDHPVIKIFEKTKQYPLNYYDQLLRQ